MGRGFLGGFSVESVLSSQEASEPQSSPVQVILAHAREQFRQAQASTRPRQGDRPDGSLQKAALLCHSAADMDPTNPQVHELMAEICWAMGDLEGALLAYRRLVSYTDRPEWALMQMARVQLVRGRLERAESLIRKSLRRKATVPGHQTAAAIYSELKDVQSEVTHLQAAVKLDPTDPQALYNVGYAYLKTDQPRRACLVYERLLEIAPDRYSRIHYNLGTAYRRLGHLRLAEEFLSRAVEREPDYAPARNNLASVLAAQGRYPEAVEQYGRAVELAPRMPEFWANLALAHLEAGSPEQARREALQAIALNADNQMARHVLAEIQTGRAAKDEG